MGDPTDNIRETAPKAWAYLEKHSGILDKRKSIIYKKKPRFSVFGIGDYSFAPWKVAISGLYKTLNFSAIGSINGKQIMVDDTCYSIPCTSENEAHVVARLLNSEEYISYLKSLVFFDAKRPVNVDILKRINLMKLSELANVSENFLAFLPFVKQKKQPKQLDLFKDKS